MSGAHCTEQKLEGVWCHSLHAPSIQPLLQEYKQLLQQLLGPKAGTMLFHLSGGLDSFIYSSSELIKRIQPHHPSLQFVNCLMEAQNSAFGCLGLYVGVLCLSLLKELLLLADNFKEGLSQRAVKEATNLIMAQIVCYLDTKPNNVVAKLDLSNLDKMLALVGTTIGSKNLGLNCQEKQHLIVKIVEAFLATIPSNIDDKEFDPFSDVTVTVVEGRSVTETQVFQGVLYREPDPNSKLIDAIIQKKNTSHCSSASNSSGLEDKALHNARQNELLNNKNTYKVQASEEYPPSKVFGSVSSDSVPNRLAITKYSRNILDKENDTCSTPHLFHTLSCIRVVLFNVPLVFEQSETECLKFTGSGSNSEVYDTLMVTKLKHLVHRCRVDVLACQKVISDVIKFELQRDGVLVLERLGTALTDSLQQLSGCVAISDVAGILTPPNTSENKSNETKTNNFNARDNDADFNGFVGRLTDISVVKVSGNTYLQLENSHQRPKVDEVDNHTSEGLIDQVIMSKGSPVVTFLLPAHSLTSESLKAVVEESLRVLRHVTLHPLVAAAGGCFEAALAHWTTAGREVSSNEEVTTNGLVGGLSTQPSDAPHLTSSAEAESEAGEGAQTVDELLAGVDRLLQGECDAAEDAVSELQLRQIARVFAKVFANLSVLLSGGTSASSFDFSIDTRTSHLIPAATPDLLYSDRPSSSADDKPCHVRCSCQSTVITCSRNPKKADFMDLRRVFEHQPALINLPSQSISKNHDFENPSTLSSRNASNKVGSIRSDIGKTLDITGFQSSGKTFGKCVSPSYVYEVTADCLVESYFAKVNAIRLAFEGVVQLLSVDYCVFDG